MFDIKKKAASFALVLALGTGAYAPFFAEESLPQGAALTAYAKDITVKATSFTDYSADANSVTLTWKKVSGATGYRIYKTVNGVDTDLLTIRKNVNSVKIEKLSAGTNYSFRIRAYVKGEDKNYWSAKSAVYNTITAPVKNGFKITSVKSYTNDTKVTVKWDKVKCTGYLLYIYDCHAQEWVMAANVTGMNNTEYVFTTSVKAPGGKYPLYYVAGGTYGYQFALRPYTTDKDKHHTLYSPSYKQTEPYYNVNTLANYYGEEYTLLSKILPKLKASAAPAYYYTYTTSKDSKTGKISSTSTKSYVSDASKKAYDAFAKAHFGKSWTDAQKVLYTLNWINKNSEYDYKYQANAGGYLANVLTQRLGQCNSYNGAIAEMLTYLGYKNVYLQCMTPSVRSGQHYRTELTYGKKTYSFEAGNMRKYEGWLWLFEEYDEVPLKS